jgi:hypothetical protein
MKIHEILKLKEQNTCQGSRGQISADPISPILDEIQPSRITRRREQVASHSPSNTTQNRQR